LKLAQALSFIAALGALAAAYFGYQGDKRVARFVADFGSMSSGIGDSPILASGGSMTFRITGTTWNCDPPPSGQNYHTKCVSSGMVPTGTVRWDNVVPTTGNVGTFGWQGLTTAWTLKLWARDDSGNSAKVGRVEICTTSTNTIGSASCDAGTSYVLIAAKGAGVHGGSVGLADSNATDNGALTAVQYLDTSCDVHLNANKSVQACEHPGYIESSIDAKTYKCRHGGCQIGIDK
jgi:hypothetical protein